MSVRVNFRVRREVFNVNDPGRLGLGLEEVSGLELGLGRVSLLMRA